jgi:hypothetical protein
MARKDKMVVGVFRDRLDADRVFDRLLGMGYLDSEVSVLMSDQTRDNYYTATGTRDTEERKHEAGSLATEGMAVGGAVGTAVGAAIAAVLAVGTTLAIPTGGGSLLIAGPIAAALAGGGAGAVTGGLLGALVGYGIPEQNVQAYEEVLREGGVVLGVVPRSNDDAKDIEKAFKAQNGENVCTC